MVSGATCWLGVFLVVTAACGAPAAKDEPPPPASGSAAPTPAQAAPPKPADQLLGAFTRLTFEQYMGGPGWDLWCGGKTFSWTWEPNVHRWTSQRCTEMGGNGPGRVIPGQGRLSAEAERELESAVAAIRLGPKVEGNVSDGGATRLHVARPGGATETYLVIDDGAPDEPAPIKYAGSARHAKQLTQLAINLALGLPN
jgi:hypothetical protein